MKDPLAPEPEPTGNLLYVMSESYVAASGIAKHMELGNKEKAEWFGKMMEYNGKYGHHMDMGSTTVYTALEDTQPASIYQAGTRAFTWLCLCQLKKKKRLMRSGRNTRPGCEKVT